MKFYYQGLAVIFWLTLPGLLGYASSNEWFRLNKMRDVDICMVARENIEFESPKYLLQFDGGSRGNPGSGGSGAVIYENQKEIWNGYFYLGSQGITNNVAEYWGLVHGLRQCAELGLKNITIQGDSELILRQVQGIYQVKNVVLKELYFRAVDLMKGIPGMITIQHIPREQNKRADFLSNMAMDLKSSESNLSPEFVLAQKPVNRAGTAKGFSRPPKPPPSTTIIPPTDNSSPSTSISIPSTLPTADNAPFVVAEKKDSFSHSIHIVPLIEWPKLRPTQIQTQTQMTQTEHISILLAESKRFLSFISINFNDSHLKRLLPTNRNNNNRTVILKASDDFIIDFLRKSRIKGTILKTEDFLQLPPVTSVTATLQPPLETEETEDHAQPSGESCCTYFIKILGTSQLSTKLNKAMAKLSSRLPSIDSPAASTIITTATAATTTKKKRVASVKKKTIDIPRSLSTLDVDSVQLFDLVSLLPDLKQVALKGIQVDRKLYGWALGQSLSLLTILATGSNGAVVNVQT